MYIGRSEEAAEVAREGLLLARETHSHAALQHGVATVAAFAERRGDAEAATRLLGAADAIRMELGEVEQRSGAEERERLESALRDAVGAPGYAQLLAEGQRMSLDEAVEYALASID